MKFRKVISLLSVLTMSMSIFGTIVSAADAPVISASVTQFTEDDYTNAGVDPIEGYDAYKLVTKISGVDLNRNNNNRATGKFLSTFEVRYTISAADQAKIDANNSYAYDYLAEPSTDAVAGIGYTISYAASTDFPGKNTTISFNDVSPVFTSVLYVRTGKSITLTLEDENCYVETSEYNNASFVSGSKVPYNPGSFTIDSGSRSLTIGTPAEPVAPTVTVKAGTVEYKTEADYVAAFGGLYNDCYTQGVKATYTVAENGAAVKGFNKLAITMADTDKPAVVTLNSMIQAAGEITVALNIQNVPTGVSLELASAAAAY